MIFITYTKTRRQFRHRYDNKEGEHQYQFATDDTTGQVSFIHKPSCDVGGRFRGLFDVTL